MRASPLPLLTCTRVAGEREYYVHAAAWHEEKINRRAMCFILASYDKRRVVKNKEGSQRGAYEPSLNYSSENYFFISVRKLSSAATIDGALGAGALMSSLKPWSSTALEVVGPKAPISVPF